MSNLLTTNSRKICVQFTFNFLDKFFSTVHLFYHLFRSLLKGYIIERYIVLIIMFYKEHTIKLLI